MSKKVKDWLLLLVKIIISLLAIIYILKRIRPGEISSLIISCQKTYLFIALLLFIASKIVAAFRAHYILRSYSIEISVWNNLQLYWIGMFYNLFLPGGIGGDVYKTVIINKLHENGLKASAGTVIMDRIAGFAALVILALFFLLFTSIYGNYRWISYAGIPVVLFGFIGIVIFLTPKLITIITKLLGLSFITQALQVVAVIFLLLAFDINAYFTEYTVIFLTSSVAAMLPLSVGGVGIRELVFFSGSSYLGLDQDVAVSISFTFYLISAFVSLWGLIAVFRMRSWR